MRTVHRHSTPTYFVLTGSKHCSELGRLVLNTCIQMGRSNELEFAKCSWVSFTCREPAFSKAHCITARRCTLATAAIVRRDETLAGLIYDRRAAERDRRHLTEATAFVPRTCLLSPGGRLPPGAPPPGVAIVMTSPSPTSTYRPTSDKRSVDCLAVDCCANGLQRVAPDAETCTQKHADDEKQSCIAACDQLLATRTLGICRTSPTTIMLT